MSNVVSKVTESVPKIKNISTDKQPDAAEILSQDFSTTLEAPKKGLFIVRTASQCIEDAATRPDALQLFGEFWHQNEFGIFFGDTGTGKSITAVQIAQAIATGKPALPFFEAAKQAPAEKVLYFDLELSDKQFQSRYQPDSGPVFPFSPNFYRIEISTDIDMPEAYKSDFEAYLCDQIEALIVETGAKVVIIDNLTFLKSGTEKAADALPLVKFLKKLKAKHTLSILCLGHTPKRITGEALTKNDLGGSKQLQNFVDTLFAIGESRHDSAARYLKQLKARETAINYDTSNVVTGEIIKDGNYLHFKFTKFSNERDHTGIRSAEDEDNTDAQILTLHRNKHTQRQIAEKISCSLGKVNKVIKRAGV